MQGSFSVWTEHKKGHAKVKDLARFKPMQRHLFLHEKALLFCKRREENGEGYEKAPSYSFKQSLSVRTTERGVTFYVLEAVISLSLFFLHLTDECCGHHWKCKGRQQEVWNLEQLKGRGLYCSGMFTHKSTCHFFFFPLACPSSLCPWTVYVFSLFSVCLFSNTRSSRSLNFSTLAVPLWFEGGIYGVDKIHILHRTVFSRLHQLMWKLHGWMKSGRFWQLNWKHAEVGKMFMSTLHLFYKKQAR